MGATAVTKLRIVATKQPARHSPLVTRGCSLEAQVA